MKNTLKGKLRNFIKTFLNPTVYTHIRYFVSHGKLLNIRSPKSFTEKIQYRKLVQNPKVFAPYVDKLEVKKIISDLKLDLYIPKTLDIIDFSEPDNVDFNKYLDSGFVIKTTHGGGAKYVEVIAPREKFDTPLLVRRFKSLLSHKTGEQIDEFFYDVIPPRVFLEENLTNFSLGELIDYKFHVFNGRVEFVQLNHRKNLNEYTMTLVDREFNKLPFTLDKTLDSLDELELVIPSNFNEALDLAERLASGFKYVRVDLYITEDKLIFGELTFCPSSGWSRVHPQTYDLELGKLWDVQHEFISS